jgi:uncharacterized membrane protein
MNPGAIISAIAKFFPLKTWLLIGGVLLAISAVLWFGHARYQDGVADADARWVAAGERLAKQAEKAGTVADKREAVRIEDHAAAVAAEKERIDEAVAAGDSPLDVLFGGL